MQHLPNVSATANASLSNRDATALLRSYYTKHFLHVSKQLFPAEPARWGPLPWEPAARTPADDALFTPSSSSVSFAAKTPTRRQGPGGAHGDELDAMRRKVLGRRGVAARDADPAVKRKRPAALADADADDDEDEGRAAAVSRRASKKRGLAAPLVLKADRDFRRDMPQTGDHADDSDDDDDIFEAAPSSTGKAAAKPIPTAAATTDEAAERKRLRKQRKRAARKKRAAAEGVSDNTATG